MPEASEHRSGGSPPAWPAGAAFRAGRARLAATIVAIGAAILVFAVGIGVGRLTGSEAGGGASASGAAGGPDGAVLFWTCSMHPQIKLPKFGQCPICFMDLTPVRAGESSAGGGRIGLSERARRLARVETAAVELRELTHTVELVGKVAADETRITYISSYIPGRLDRLYVNFTGGFVRRGDHLAEIYSPQLLVAQREYLMAYESARRSAGSASAPSGAQPMLDAARTRLELWGVPKDQIRELERRREPSDHMRIDAPQEGWVLERAAYEGMYVETGVRLFSLVDLRHVWVFLAAYEQDLSLLRAGQTVTFEAEAHPGRAFSGTIAYIDPTLSESTRTVRVRVNVPNADLALKPGMFVRAGVHVRIGERGQVVGPDLAGKWVCYMHPDVIKSEAGSCDVCGMDLVTAESLGMAGGPAVSPDALAIPRSAVLLTGRRAIVYVHTAPGAGDDATSEGEWEFEPREIEIGPRVGEFYVVLDGLHAGERVVVHGAAQIDSAVQIQGKPSMMQPEDAAPGGGERFASHWIEGAAYHPSLAAVTAAYLELTRALAADDLAAGRSALDRLRTAVDGVSADGLAPAAAAELMTRVASLKAAAASTQPAGGGGPDIEAIRVGLPKTTEAMYRLLRSFGHTREAPIVRAFCPMAFDDKGAEWLQAGDEIANPYFGATMLRCGEIRGRIRGNGRESR